MKKITILFVMFISFISCETVDLSNDQNNFVLNTELEDLITTGEDIVLEPVDETLLDNVDDVLAAEEPTESLLDNIEIEDLIAIVEGDILDDSNNGHGNDDDGFDESNPGKANNHNENRNHLGLTEG